MGRLMPVPYKTTPVFDEDSLPPPIRNEHRTKPGVWGLLRVLEGQVHLVFEGQDEPLVITPERAAMIPPETTHHVETIGPMRMQVEFYHEPPNLTGKGVGSEP